MTRAVDQEKRMEIANAAMSLLRQRGLSGTTMSSIARELGMKRPTLYWYFPDIPSILEFLLDDLRQREAAYVGARILGKPNPLDVLEAWVQAEHAFHAQEGTDDFLVLLTQFWSSGSAEERERFRRVSLQNLEPVRMLAVGAIAQGIQQGTVKPCDPEAVVDLMLVFMDGAMLHRAVRGMDPSRLYPFLHALLEDLKCET